MRIWKYNQKTNPKLKIKNKNIEENNDINQNVKESKRYKSPISFSNKETIKEINNTATSVNPERERFIPKYCCIRRKYYVSRI